MKRLWWLVLLFAMPSFASTVSISATLTDSDSQTWNNCIYAITLVSPKGSPTISGVAATPTLVQGTCNSSGVLSATVVNTSSLDQSSAYQSFYICPNAGYLGSPTCYTITSTTTGSENLSTVLSAGIKAPRFPSGPTAYGYNNSEVKTPVTLGQGYFNVGLPGWCISGNSGWLCASGGSAYNPASVAITGGTINGATIGATTPAIVYSTQFITSGTQPTCAVGVAAGTGGSVGCAITTGGTNQSGVMTVTSGSTGGSAGVFATVTFAGTLTVAPRACLVSPNSSAGTGASGLYPTANISTPTTSGWTASATAGLSTSNTFSYSYICL